MTELRKRDKKVTESQKLRNQGPERHPGAGITVFYATFSFPRRWNNCLLRHSSSLSDSSGPSPSLAGLNPSLLPALFSRNPESVTKAGRPESQKVTKSGKNNKVP